MLSSLNLHACMFRIYYTSYYDKRRLIDKIRHFLFENKTIKSKRKRLDIRQLMKEKLCDGDIHRPTYNQL